LINTSNLRRRLDVFQKIGNMATHFEQRTMTKTSTLLLLALAGITSSLKADDKWDIAKIDVSKLPAAAGTSGVTYAKDIRPIFEASCFRCHGAQKPKADLRLDSLEAILKGGEDGKIVVSGNSKKSLVVAAVARVNDDVAMPPKFKPHPGGPGGPPPTGGTPPPGGGPGGPGGPRGFGPPTKPLTPEQVGLVRAWIDQGAK
jgi:hypothetical protein